METVHMVILPQLAVQFVFPAEECLEINEHGNRFTGNIPTADFDRQPFGCSLLLPGGKELFILLEIRGWRIGPAVGSEEYHVIFYSVL